MNNLKHNKIPYEEVSMMYLPSPTKSAYREIGWKLRTQSLIYKV